MLSCLFMQAHESRANARLSSFGGTLLFDLFKVLEMFQRSDNVQFINIPMPANSGGNRYEIATVALSVTNRLEHDYKGAFVMFKVSCGHQAHEIKAYEHGEMELLDHADCHSEEILKALAGECTSEVTCPKIAKAIYSAFDRMFRYEPRQECV